MTAEIIPFPSKLCCQCGEIAPVEVKLIDYETGFPDRSKFFCREHDPNNQTIIPYTSLRPDIFDQTPRPDFNINEWANAIKQLIETVPNSQIKIWSDQDSKEFGYD